MRWLFARADRRGAERRRPLSRRSQAAVGGAGRLRSYQGQCLAGVFAAYRGIERPQRCSKIGSYRHISGESEVSDPNVVRGRIVILPANNPSPVACDRGSPDGAAAIGPRPAARRSSPPAFFDPLPRRKLDRGTASPHLIRVAGVDAAGRRGAPWALERRGRKGAS